MIYCWRICFRALNTLTNKQTHYGEKKMTKLKVVCRPDQQLLFICSTNFQFTHIARLVFQTFSNVHNLLIVFVAFAWICTLRQAEFDEFLQVLNALILRHDWLLHFTATATHSVQNSICHNNYQEARANCLEISLFSRNQDGH
jgi:hypothetical protein